MGQVIGRATLHPSVLPFVNLPYSILYDIWEAFNDVAEGFGLTSKEFHDIFRLALKDYFNFSPTFADQKIREQNDALFCLFHSTDEYQHQEQDMVDSFEVLCCMALISGMAIEEKLRFIFGIFDLEEVGKIQVEQLTLCMRSCTAGMKKLMVHDNWSSAKDVFATICSTEIDVDEEDVNAYSLLAFDPDFFQYFSKTKEKNYLMREDFVSFAMKSPEIFSWIEYFGYLEEKSDVNSCTRDSVDVLHPEKVSYIRKEGFSSVSRQPYHTSTFCLKPCHNHGPTGEPTIKEETLQQNVVVEESSVCTMKLEWIYGLNGIGTKQHVHCVTFATNKNAIVYPAGATCVRLCTDTDKDDEMTQEYYFGHADYIMSLCVGDSEDGIGSIVASAEFGPHPSIHIWSVEKLSTLAVLKGFHTDGISCVDFSPNMTYLVSMGMDYMQSIAVYDWKNRSVVYSTRTSKRKIFDCRFLNDNSFAICGDEVVSFYVRKEKDESFGFQQGLLGRKCPRQIMRALTYFNGHTIISGSSDSIYVWDGRACIEAHKICYRGYISTMRPSIEENVLIICTSAGVIQLTNSRYEVIREIDTTIAGGLQSEICSVSQESNEKFLVTLRSNEILKIDEYGNLNEMIVQGHSGKNFSGLASNPILSNEFVTVGSDNTLKVWNINIHNIIRMVQLNSPAMCVALSPNAERIVVGYGAINYVCEKNGAFAILDYKSLQILHEGKNAKGALVDCKFSVDGSILAFASADGSVYLYKSNQYEFISRTKRLPSPLLRVDLGVTEDERKLVRCISESKEICFFNLRGKQESPRIGRHAKWESWSCTVDKYSIPFAPSDGAVLKQSDASSKASIGAIVDSFGRICVLPFPFEIGDSYYPFGYERGHAANIGNVKFLNDGKSLLTTGEDDCCVFQWNLCDLKMSNIHFKSSLMTSELQEIDLSSDRESVNGEECLPTEENFVPTRPWQRTISAPRQNIEHDVTFPNHDLELEKVFGFNSHLRNNIVYNETVDSVVFPNGSILVKQCIHTEKQEFFNELKKEAQCLAMHPNKMICAVGEKGYYSHIFIFDVVSMTSKKVFQSHHSIGTSLMKFNPIGELLLTVGCDVFNTIIIYDWENETILFEHRSSIFETLAIDFALDGEYFIQCGVNFVKFWYFTNAHHSVKVELDNDIELQTFYAIGWSGNAPFVGAEDGKLYILSCDSCSLNRTIKAHMSSVVSISSTTEGNVTASRDGILKIWTIALLCVHTIDLRPSFGSSMPIDIQSMIWIDKDDMVFIGLKSNEIWKISMNDSSEKICKQVGKGLAGNLNLCAMAVHPFESKFCTIGGDKKLVEWSIHNMRPIKSIDLEMLSLACTYSPRGHFLAVGFGYPHAKNKLTLFDGKWIILSTDNDFSLQFEARDAMKAISAIKWSASGDIIAVGSYDWNIYLYRVEEGEGFMKCFCTYVLKKHKASIETFDFTSDSSILRSNCAAMELVFWNINDGSMLRPPSKARDLKWDTQSCSLTWATQGLWPRVDNGTCSIKVDCNFGASDGDYVIASGNNLGILNICRYPCSSQICLSKTYRGHNGPISKVQWTKSGSHLISTSAPKNSIFVYRHVIDDSAIVDEVKAINKNLNFSSRTDCSNLNSLYSLFERKEVCKVDNRKPWYSIIMEPSTKAYCTQPDPSKPNIDILLSQVHGSNTSFKASLVCNKRGQLIYPVAALCVVQNRASGAQLFYDAHDGFISCLSMNKKQDIVASSSISTTPEIRLWDPNTCRTFAVFKSVHQHGITCMDFSYDNRLLVSIGLDTNHSIAVWSSPSGKWDVRFNLSHSFCGEKEVLFVKFLNNATYDFVTGGIDHLFFWSIDGQTLVPSKALFGDKGEPQQMNCGCIFRDLFLTGSNQGVIYVWRERNLYDAITSDNKQIHSICSNNDKIFTGNEKGEVSEWSMEFKIIRTFSCQRVQNSFFPVTSLHVPLAGHHNSGSILAGTSDGSHFEISIFTSKSTVLIEGHSKGDFAWHPFKEDIFASCNSDGFVIFWSATLQKSFARLHIARVLHCIEWSLDGKEIVIGCTSRAKSIREKQIGKFLIIECNEMNVKFEGGACESKIIHAKYSPCNKFFGLATEQGRIYIHRNDSKKHFNVEFIIDANAGPISSFDFSSDSYLIRCSTFDYNLNYYSMDDGSFIDLPSQVKNVDWFTNHCTFTWPTQGIWPSKNHYDKGTEPQSVDVSFQHGIIAHGNFRGELKVQNFPCIDKNAEYMICKGQVGGISRCRFSSNGQYIATVGENDCSLFIWMLRTS